MKQNQDEIKSKTQVHKKVKDEFMKVKTKFSQSTSKNESFDNSIKQAYGKVAEIGKIVNKNNLGLTDNAVDLGRVNKLCNDVKKLHIISMVSYETVTQIFEIREEKAKALDKKVADELTETSVVDNWIAEKVKSIKAKDQDTDIKNMEATKTETEATKLQEKSPLLREMKRISAI